MIEWLAAIYIMAGAVGVVLCLLGIPQDAREGTSPLMDIGGAIIITEICIGILVAAFAIAIAIVTGTLGFA